MSSGSRWSLAAAFAGLACGQAGEGAPVVGEPVVAEAVVGEPVVAAPVVAAPVVAAPVVPQPATMTPPPTPVRARGISGMTVPDDAPRFVEVARAEGEGGDWTIELFAATDGQPFLAIGPLLLRLTSEGSIESEPSWVRGIADGSADLDAFESGMVWWNATAFGGTWPESAYLVIEQRSGFRGGGSPPELFKRTGEKWTRVATRRGPLAWYPRSFGPWKDGSLLALKAFQPIRADDEGVARGSREEMRAFERALAREKRLVVLRGEPKAPAFGEREIREFASLASGEIWALLEEGDRPAVLHFDGASEKVIALPGSERGTLGVLGLRATAADRVWAFGMRRGEEAPGGYMARFDGTGWTEVESGCASAVESLTIDADGYPYYRCLVEDGERAVLLRLREGTIEELPTELEPRTVLARRGDDVWVLAAGQAGGYVLLHSGSTRAEPLALPGSLEVARSVFEWEDTNSYACNRVWIPLAAGSDRAAVERTVAGLVSEHYEVEVIDARVQGRVEAGVMVRMLGGAKLRKFNALRRKLGAAVGGPTCNQRPAVGRAGD